MDQAEQENRDEKIRRFDADESLEAIEVFERFVADSEGDHRIDQIEVRFDLKDGREDQGDAVAQCEGRDEFHDVSELREEKHHAEEE